MKTKQLAKMTVRRVFTLKKIAHKVRIAGVLLRASDFRRPFRVRNPRIMVPNRVPGFLRLVCGSASWFVLLMAVRLFRRSDFFRSQDFWDLIANPQ